MVEKNSKKYELNKKDGIKIAKSFGIAFGGLVLTFATDLIPNVDWGTYAPLVVAMSGVLINAGWKLLKGSK